MVKRKKLIVVKIAAIFLFMLSKKIDSITYEYI
jgi:hypothetical protein